MSPIPEMSQIFSRSVEDATNTAARDQKPLLVYVTNRPDAYDPDMARILSGTVASKVSEMFVLVMLAEGTVDFKQFQRLYRVPVIPSLMVVSSGQVLQSMTQFTEANFDKLLKFKPPQQNEYPQASGRQGSIAKSCVLSFRLLDGTTLRKQFDETNTLNEVRLWLDTQSGIDIIPESNSMPSFTRPDGLHATRYAFQSPSIPRTTFEDHHEFMTLTQLNLMPRSVLVLKPLFDESVKDAYEHNRSVLKSVNTSVRQFCNAVYSFFDYGVDEDNDDTIDMVDHKSPQVFSIGDQQKRATVINFENDYEEQPAPELERTYTPELKGDERESRGPSSIKGSQPSITKVETIQDQEESETKVEG